MNDPQQPEEPSEENLFAAPLSIEHARSIQPEYQPGGIAYTISILIAVAVSIPVFMVTFFFTCLGVISVKSLDNEAGLAITAIIALATTIVSLILVTKGILALIRLFHR
jgi:hypothetical protein